MSARIADTYHAWRGDDGEYEDVPGFCKAAVLDDVRSNGHVLTPGRYVGAAETLADNEPSAHRLQRLSTELDRQFTESSRLQKLISSHLATLVEIPSDE